MDASPRILFFRQNWLSLAVSNMKYVNYIDVDCEENAVNMGFRSVVQLTHLERKTQVFGSDGTTFRELSQ